MEKFDATGLSKEWDETENLRQRIRNGHPMLAGTMNEYSINRCCINIAVLSPLLVRSTACGHKRPEVENLRDEVSTFLSMNHRPDAGDDEIDDAAWELRKLLTFLKRKAQRKEVSTVTCPILGIFCPSHISQHKRIPIEREEV